MGIVNSTGVLDRALGNMIHRLRDKALVIIPIYIFATALLGCVGSMISTVVLFVPLGITIARQLKADRIFAVGLVILGSFTGFMTSPINPLTGVLGQEIAGLAPYSGAGLRTIVTIVNLAVVSAYLIFWVKRCQKNPDVYEKNFGDGSDDNKNNFPHAHRCFFLFCCFFLHFFSPLDCLPPAKERPFPTAGAYSVFHGRPVRTAMKSSYITIHAIFYRHKQHFYRTVQPFFHAFYTIFFFPQSSAGRLIV